MINLSMQATIKANKPIAHLISDDDYGLPTIDGLKVAAGEFIYDMRFNDGTYKVDTKNNTITCDFHDPINESKPEIIYFGQAKAYTDIKKLCKLYLTIAENDENLFFGVLDVTIKVIDTEISPNPMLYTLSDQIINNYNAKVQKTRLRKINKEK